MGNKDAGTLPTAEPLPSAGAEAEETLNRLIGANIRAVRSAKCRRIVSVVAWSSGCVDDVGAVGRDERNDLSDLSQCPGLLWLCSDVPGASTLDGVRESGAEEEEERRLRLV
jgi:hypothetical protein